jgi:hypothetical protein
VVSAAPDARTSFSVWLRPLAAFTTNSAGNAIVNTDDGPNKMSAEFIANRIQEEAHDQL